MRTKRADNIQQVDTQGEETCLVETVTLALSLEVRVPIHIHKDQARPSRPFAHNYTKHLCYSMKTYMLYRFYLQNVFNRPEGADPLVREGRLGFEGASAW